MNQSHFDTSEICRLHGVRYAVFSPGSRNAALSVSFARNKKISTYIIVDERSAGFIALGIAQQTQSPVVLCCTSGTALLNYGPAIAEAFYQEIPLIILSADRPPEWIDQWDGQTIRQQNVFSRFVKGFYQLPANPENEESIQEYRQKISNAILTAQNGKKGPFHLNIPFREPFYPSENQKPGFSDNLKRISELPFDLSLPDNTVDLLKEQWQSAHRKLIIMGQGWPSLNEVEALEQLSTEQNIPVINDIISNSHSINNVITHQDLFLQKKAHWDVLKPDLILTFGKSVISKNLKLFLRESSAPEWRISREIHTEDPFRSLEKIIRVSLIQGLRQLHGSKPQDRKYRDSWVEKDQLARALLQELNELPYSEFVSFAEVMRKLPDGIDLHLANSMPVRFANFIQGLSPDIRIYANRGTSGIDGTNGTAVGHALTTDRKVVVLSGDLSFLYDRNAFFHAYDLSNLVFIVFNNFGGGIFDLIPGPLSLEQKIREQHFITPHGKDLKHTALDAGFAYSKANDLVTLDLALSGIFAPGTKPKLLEIQTDPKINQRVYFEIKKLINE